VDGDPVSSQAESVAPAVDSWWPKCEQCDRPALHEGRHEATFPFVDASPGWTGSPEQWAVWNAHVAAGTAITVRVIELPPASPAVTHTEQNG